MPRTLATSPNARPWRRPTPARNAETFASRRGTTWQRTTNARESAAAAAAGSEPPQSPREKTGWRKQSDWFFYVRTELWIKYFKNWQWQRSHDRQRDIKSRKNRGPDFWCRSCPAASGSRLSCPRPSFRHIGASGQIRQIEGIPNPNPPLTSDPTPTVDCWCCHNLYFA